MLAAGCVGTLPNQDRRILTTAPAAKLSADVLWKEFRADGSGATRRYHGEALLFTGSVTSVTADGPDRSVFFAEEQTHGIQARLLDDQAATVLAAAQTGGRITLKCFCEGFDGNVVLKSCIKP